MGNTRVWKHPGLASLKFQGVSEGVFGESHIPRGPCDRKNSIPIENFNLGLKFSVSIENFTLDRKFQSRGVSIYGALLVYREGLDRKFQSTIDRSKFSIPKAAIEFFQSPGPLSGKSKWGLKALGGLRHLSTIVHDCLRLSSFCDDKSP